MSKAYAKSFYNSKDWRACRDLYVQKRIKVDGGKCEKCREQIGSEVHHIAPINLNNINDARVTLNHDNLTLLCRDCHFKVHREMILESQQRDKYERVLHKGCYYDDNGQLKQMQVYIVWGAPWSGKLDRIQRERGDLIVNLDSIRWAIGSDRNLLNLSLMIREYMFDLIEKRDESIDCRNVWVVATLPRRADRRELAKRLNAKLIFCDVNMQSCVERMSRSDSKEKQVERAAIERWFEEYEAD